MRGVRTVSTAVAMLLLCGVVAAGAAVSGDVWSSTTHVDQVQAHGYTGAGQVVAIIDSGVADVPGLGGALIKQVNLSGAPDTGDQYGHGTFVAGLVHRAAPDAKIISIKLSGADGSVDVSQVLAALQWVCAFKDEYGIDVVNLSFGNDSKQPYRTSPLNYAVERAWDAGMVVVTSSGNAGGTSGASGTVTKPGDDPLAISVGASDDQMTSTLADDVVPTFSSRGPTQDGLAKPDVVAPGTHVVSLRAPGSTVDTQHPGARVGIDEFRGSGTSFAAAIVSGVAAQLRQEFPDATPDEVKALLLDGARPIGADAGAQGQGSIDAALSSIAGLRRANAGVERSTGRGSVDESRGSQHVEVKLPVVGALPVVGDVVKTVAGDETAQGKHFDTVEYTASQWGASQWGASQWGASQWGASQWGASQWGASQWWASQWG